MTDPGPPRLADWSPDWAAHADLLISDLKDRTRHLKDADRFDWQHIGSTSVPGLAAKPIIDLQLGVPSLDHLEGLDEAVLATGFADVAKLRPGSPGVLRDQRRGNAAGPDVRWDKRLFAAAGVILHVRQIGTPWWAYTVRFRDLLRAEPETRQAYEQMKRRLTETHAQDPDYDRYTLAKTAFFDTIQHRIDVPRTGVP